MLRSSKRRVSGFTLIELMVVLTILAIIMLIGYPMYTQQTLKGRRADARAGVMELAMAQEREYATWGGYSEPSIPIVGITRDDDAPVPDANSTFNSDVQRIAEEYRTSYTFNITATDGTFTITATPTGGQVDDAGCASFGIDQTGTKTATNLDLCW